MSWPEPPDEAERVRVLHSLDVLDVPKQEEFERITSLCGAALDVPVCLVSLVDAQRQWFLSNRGLGDVRETGRELAFCGHAIMPRSDGGLHSDEPVDVFVVRDAEADDRFRTNSLVTGWPHIRFYAGTALRVAGSDGVKRAIGTLCVIDTAVEHGGTGARCADAFGAREKQILMDFGALVVGAIEGRTAAKRTLAMAKNDYISCTAHDIRTPVACFQLSLELLAASPLSDEQREYVTDAQLCVEVITETVERAIETARQQRGAAPSPARRERVDVRGLVARVDALTKALSAQRPPLNLCVADSVPEHVASDGTLLWRCLLNYVTNAIKATPDATKSVDVAFSVVSMDRTGVTPPSTCASLLCRAGEALGPAPGEDGFPDAPEDDENVVALAPHEAPASGRWLKLEVADQGAGVPRAVRRRLFHAFVQTPGTREGTGLGLLAVKQCATMLRGACGTRPRRCHAPASPPKKKKAKLVSALDATLPATESPPAPSRPRLEQPPGDDEGSVFWLLVPLEEVTDDLEDHSSTSSVASPFLNYRLTPPGSGARALRSGSGTAPQRALPPAALPPPRPVNAPDVAPPAPPKPRHEALIVEDSSPIRKMLKRILERCEFAVDEAGNGEQGLALLCKKRYDIAIMDFLMPIMDGVTCTKKFRQWEAADRARAAAGRCLIVGSSANADAEDIKHAYESGLDDFVPKPVNVTALRTMLAKHGLLPADAPTAPAPA
ncbi:hypothetical protein AURANDRAFT_71512 [Aureococcus anophagefferens]|uniref:Uncharacterized protein n=1 Tax=Aureococcus anophagefferens TaxID=44056 RepID=F0Y7I5_AURAN|nr:hypothetical protein AURANDRAFT_71512 [Aureococcus anophagefferens]EGB09071.1 hypothetical protein AURANDRAFT_71512 [Aureococcus anophagefferens]|eukprot:XP_009036196.1 hypothetical protein AURANDRAFT_71512 [Aureococcus anophagefferens]